MTIRSLKSGQPEKPPVPTGKGESSTPKDEVFLGGRYSDLLTDLAIGAAEGLAIGSLRQGAGWAVTTLSSVALYGAAGAYSGKKFGDSVDEQALSLGGKKPNTGHKEALAGAACGLLDGFVKSSLIGSSTMLSGGNPIVGMAVGALYRALIQ